MQGCYHGNEQAPRRCPAHGWRPGSRWLARTIPVRLQRLQMQHAPAPPLLIFGNAADVLHRETVREKCCAWRGEGTAQRGSGTLQHQRVRGPTRIKRIYSDTHMQRGLACGNALQILTASTALFWISIRAGRFGNAQLPDRTARQKGQAVQG